MKIICSDALKTTKDRSTSNSAYVRNVDLKTRKNRDDLEKLNKAVFFKEHREDNIFHVMRDEITELKAEFERH